MAPRQFIDRPFGFNTRDVRPDGVIISRLTENDRPDLHEIAVMWPTGSDRRDIRIAGGYMDILETVQLTVKLLAMSTKQLRRYFEEDCI